MKVKTVILIMTEYVIYSGLCGFGFDISRVNDFIALKGSFGNVG
jgi:hypothetical protein